MFPSKYHQQEVVEFPGCDMLVDSVMSPECTLTKHADMKHHKLAIVVIYSTIVC